ncbi:di-trans,poly-cis-decaprenylcistransferase [Candidatus Saccharibacteria bacterium]|nr:MAG: di-trans,poly-cis-decaprenylcistransferase [Candidatus Saccharibacteria bacterium]
MDGNRRWARKMGKRSIRGHAAGQEVLHQIVEHAFKVGVKYLTVYAFSTENWRRNDTEVKYLMQQIDRALRKHLQEFIDAEVRIVILGSADGLSDKVKRSLMAAEQATENGTKGTLGVCLNYGGYKELVDATRKLIDSGVETQNIDDEAIERQLYHPELPPIDLVIRTGGEKRLSNFMLWRAAYSELIFRDEYWPDFTPRIFNECLVEYSKRQRRFGK